MIARRRSPSEVLINASSAYTRRQSVSVDQRGEKAKLTVSSQTTSSFSQMYCSRCRVFVMSSDLNRNLEQREVIGSMILRPRKTSVVKFGERASVSR